MRNLVWLTVVLWTSGLHAQYVSGRVIDSSTGNPIAFVAVVEQGTTNGAYSDIDGNFKLREPLKGNPINFNYVGYLPVSTSWSGQDPWEVRMEANVITTSEVVIRPGENPAERIIRKAISEKRNNDPERRTAFSYNSYNKLVFTADLDSARYRSEPIVIDDKERKEAEDYFADKHLFIMESASIRKFLPPDRSEERILANRVSGLKNPVFALLGTQIQSFSFYGESVHIFDSPYLSPLADGAIRKYLFILEDTTFIDQDTVFTISFRPRKGKNFQGMRGQLFIHTRGYALQNVIAEPAEPDPSLRIRIQQQYQLTPGGWFPDQLNSFMRFPQMLVGDSEIIGIGKSYITNLSYDQSYRSREFGPVVLMMDPAAKAQSDSVWDALRVIPLDEKERNTYLRIDSIGEAENLDRVVEKLSILAFGKVPLGKVSLDLDRIMRFNNFEGFRLGAGLHTNDFFSRHFSIGGYYAYGFRDKGHKGGADLVVPLNRKRDLKLTALWERDVMERGGRLIQPLTGPGLFMGDYYGIFINRMDRYEKKELRFSGRLIGNLSGSAFINTQDIRPWSTSYSAASDASVITIDLNDIAITETGITLRWAPGEKLARVGSREVRLGGKYPVTHFRYTRALNGVLYGTQSFDRVDAMVEKTFRIVNGGSLKLRATGGWVPGNLAPSLLYNMRGSNSIDYSQNRFLGIAVPWSFETMHINEFMCSRYATFHLRHQFRDLLLSGPKFKPYLSVVHNMLIGDRQGSSMFGHDSSVAMRPFMESGFVMDRLMVSKFSALGLGVFYRYGDHAMERRGDNLIVKLSALTLF